MSQPYDVKVSRDRLYVLSPANHLCMHTTNTRGRQATLPHYLWEKEWMCYILASSVWILSTTLSLAIPSLTQFVSSPQKEISYTQ